MSHRFTTHQPIRQLLLALLRTPAWGRLNQLKRIDQPHRTQTPENRRKSYLLWLIFLLFNSNLCIGQTNTRPNAYFFEHYSIEKGLSQGSGYAISSYNDFIWIGTQDGLNRFDGTTFNVYKSGTSHSVRDNFIQCLLTDHQGLFWVGTVKGIDLYNKETDQFVSFSDHFRIPHAVNDLAIKRLLSDRQGNIWIMTDERGIYRFNPATKQVQSFLKTHNNLADFTLAPDGTVWVVTDDEVYFYNGNTRQLQPISLKKTLRLLPYVTFRAIVCHADGAIWIGTYEDGIYSIKPSASDKSISKDQVVHYQKGTTAKTLSSNQITCLFRDKSNQIWVGSRTEGISLYRPEECDFIRIKHSEKTSRSLAADYILSFFEDRQANIWVGLSGGGIDKFDPRKAPFHVIQHDVDNPRNSLPDNMVLKIFGQDTSLYIGTQSGGMARYSMLTGQLKTFVQDARNPASIPNSQVYDISADSSKNLWLATGRGLCRFDPRKQVFRSYLQGNQKTLLYLYALKVLANQQEIWAGGQRGIYRFNLQTKTWTGWDDLPAIAGISTYVIRIIYEDSHQTIWLGTLGHGLIRYSPKTRKITVFDQKSGLGCNNIRSLLEDGKTLWIGTDCGLTRLDATSLKIQAQYSEQDGLPNNVIYGILKSGRNDLWLSSNKGITRFSPSTRFIKTYDVNNGLQSDEFNTYCTYRHSDGTFYFGGVKGISYFHVNQLTANTFVPPIKITQIKVLDSLYAPNQKLIALTHNQNFIDFNFAALNFSNTEKNTYRYRLDGINNDWVKAGTKQYASYTNLPPGKYVFRVKGSNDDGIENAQDASVGIQIIPAFYQTWWFIMGLVLAGAGLLLLLYRSYSSYQTVSAKLDKEEAIRHQKESELNEQAAAFRLKILETEMAGLRAQMNPHFIFNCLNSIQFFTARNDAETASNYLTKFSRLIRLVLENSKSERVTLANELETLRLYIEMEAMRFPQKLQYVIRVPTSIETDQIQIPPLLLQPFVENAIWHGLMHKDEGGRVQVLVQQTQENLLHIEITDDGVGRQKAADYKSKSATHNKSFGMKLTADRIELINQLYHTQTRVDIEDLVDSLASPAERK